jgi:hypothetical protein
MEARTEFKLRHAFVLTPTSLAKIWSSLEEHAGKVGAIAHCSDNVEREFNTSDELVKYENPRMRQIERLVILSQSDDGNRTAYVRFGTSRYDPITVAAKGSEADVLKIKDALIEIVDGVRAWYSRMAMVDLPFVGGLLVGFSFSIAVFGTLLAPDDIRNARTQVPFPLLVISGVIAAMVIVGAVLSWKVLCRVHARYFPVATFAFGQGEAQYDFLDKIRWVVIVGLIVSIFASLFVASLFL